MQEQQSLDLFSLEVARGRLDAIVKDMGAAQIRASNNPGTTEAKDLSCALYDAEGNGLSYAAYILFHVRSTQEGVLAILRDYGDDIRPGDAFLANDVYWGGGIHQGDACFFKPIFYTNRLLGFAAVACHMYDVGGMTPGSFAPAARECFQEALNIPPVKILRDGKWDISTLNFFINNVRTPDSNTMDLKAMLAGCLVAERRVTEMVDSYGRDEFNAICKELLTLSEIAMRRRIAEIADGVYEYTDWLEHNGHRDEVYKVHCRLTIAGEEMSFDFSESDPQTDGFINTGWCGLVGNVFTIVLQQIAPDIPFNEGFVRPVHVVCPPGRIVHAERPAPVASGHLEAGARAGTCAMATVNLALAASGPSLRKRVMGLWGDCWPAPVGAGVDQYGHYKPYAPHDGSSQGAAAMLGRDGLSISGLAAQSFNGVPDIEDTEHRYPLLYLYKGLRRDSAGSGEFRGGFGMECMWMLHDVPSDHEYTLFVGRRSIPLAGSFGGYPSTTSHWQLCHDANVIEKIAITGCLPTYPDEVAGTWVGLPPKAINVSMKCGTLFHYNNLGGGGLGDPLRRDPEWVARDVRNGWISTHQARAAYGVIVSGDGIADQKETLAERERNKIARRTRSHGAAGAPTRLAGQPTGRFLTPDLELVQYNNRIGLRCRHCETHICDSPQNWHEHVLVSEFPIGGEFALDLGIHTARRQDHAFVVREHFCPGCATLLRAQVTLTGSPAIFDSQPISYTQGASVVSDR